MALNLITERSWPDPVSLGAALVAGKKTAPDAILLLMQDHARAMDHFTWALAASDAGIRSFVVRQLCTALRAHMAVEEEILYPAARQATGDSVLVEHAYDEHAEAKLLMDRLAPVASRDVLPDDSVLKDLQDAIVRHVQEEERQLFPRLRATQLDLYELGRKLAARRTEVLRALPAIGVWMEASSWRPT